MKEGILYSVGDGLMRAGRRLSPVETLKDIVGFVAKAFSADLETQILAKRRTIEFYLFIKWAALILIWIEGTSHWMTLFAVSYLMIFNLHSYVDHHLWSPVGEMTRIRLKRRFLSLLQGVAFNIAGFGYLYSRHFGGSFESKYFTIRDPLPAICYSVFNTFAGGSGIATPETADALSVTTIQIFTTFIFVGLLFSRSTLEKGEQ